MGIRALRWVPIPMPWVLGGHGFDIIVHEWAWVGIVSRWVWIGIVFKWVHDPMPINIA